MYITYEMNTYTCKCSYSSVTLNMKQKVRVNQDEYFIDLEILVKYSYLLNFIKELFLSFFK